MSAVLPLPSKPAALRQRAHWTDRVAHALMIVIVLALVVFLALPLATILVKALQDGDGAFVGLANFTGYLATPSLLTSLWHSVWVSALVTLITLPLAFTFAYALSRSCMPLKGLARTIALVPLLAPSLLSALSLIYWFGNQGLLLGAIRALGFDGIYGAAGIVVAECFAVFPHALMILVTALALADAR
ncbi:MAG TPA: putative 2-aminoethylphosphonate ABC transporter permease subunit, partial [Burkholderiaceae bacterium]|nr:putative 2-aminoethylphosphonate ABC transporter permease subunit [Burkholderiaceae bacterium]